MTQNEKKQIEEALSILQSSINYDSSIPAILFNGEQFSHFINGVKAKREVIELLRNALYVQEKTTES